MRRFHAIVKSHPRKEVFSCIVTSISLVTAAKRVKPSYLSRMCGDGYGYVFQKQVQCSAHHYFPNTLAIYLFINVHFISAFSLLDSKVSMRGN